MTFVTAGLKEGIEKMRQVVGAPEYAPKKPATVVTATMTGPQASVAKWPNFSVISDEPPSIGGGDTAPPPSAIFVASIGFAENVIFARDAGMAGLDFDSMETKVSAAWDIRGLFGIRGIDPSITELAIETSVMTAANPAKVAEVLRMNDSRCPMTTTVAKVAKVTRKLLVNGTEVAL